MCNCTKENILKSRVEYRHRFSHSIKGQVQHLFEWIVKSSDSFLLESDFTGSAECFWFTKKNQFIRVVWFWIELHWSRAGVQLDRKTLLVVISRYKLFFWFQHIQYRLRTHKTNPLKYDFLCCGAKDSTTEEDLLQSNARNTRNFRTLRKY